MFRKLDKAIRISELYILVGEQYRITETANRRSSGWITWVGGEGHWVIGDKKVKFLSAE